MIPRIGPLAARPRRAAVLRRGRAALALVLAPLAGACAGAMQGAAPPLELRQADGVVWVRASESRAGARVVLSGAPVYVLNGEREMRGDTLYVRTPFAIGVPDGAFELTVAAQRARGAVRGLPPVAELRFTTLDDRGMLETVRAEGAQLVLRRQANGGPLAVTGARRVETRSAASIAAR